MILNTMVAIIFEKYNMIKKTLFDKSETLKEDNQKNTMNVSPIKLCKFSIRTTDCVITGRI